MRLPLLPLLWHVQEFDYEPDLAAVNAFQDNYLSVPQAGGLQGLRYKYAYAAPVNTGVPSGRDFDHDGKASGPDDCFGFGLHPGVRGAELRRTAMHVRCAARARRGREHHSSRCGVP